MREIGFEERKKLQLDIMNVLDAFCRENNLTYYLAFGTLLGAARHNGYIPWDDDIDIMMPREDYERLERIFPTDGRYRFLTSKNTKNFPYAFGKVIDTLTIKNEAIRPKYQMIGLDIDVFPIDNYPDDYGEAQSWSLKIRSLQDKMHQLMAQYAKGRNIQRTIVRNLLISLRHLIDDLGIATVERYVSNIDVLSQKYNNIQTSYCGIASLATYGVKKRNRIEVYSSKVEVDFEGYKFFAPVGYDEYLKDTYGDYMQLPPIEKRVTHHSNKVFWK